MAREDVASHGWRRLAIATIAVAVTLAGSGCGGSSAGNAGGKSAVGSSFYTGWTPGGTPVRGGKVTIDSAETVSNFNPFNGAAVSGYGLPEQVLDQLVEFVPRSNAPSQVAVAPALASSWSVSSNHLTYTFHIRPGVRFSNGEPLTGEDVIFSLDKSKLPTNSFAILTKSWKKVVLADPMTVQIQLSEPQPGLIETLTGLPFSIVPKKTYERVGGKAFGLHPVGTGPFVLKSATAGFTTVTFARNPHYWRAGQPYLDELVWNQVENDNARIIAVRSGAAAIATGIPYSQVASLEKTPGVRMLVGPEWGASLNLFNRAKAPFNNHNVVKALLYATPREQIIKSVYYGIGTPSNSIWGQLKYWDSKVPLFPYDIAKAKELLKRSPYPHGFSVTINLTNGESQGALLASILQSSWAKIGVHATIQSLPSATLDANFFSGKYEFDVFPPEAGFTDSHSPEAGSLFYVDNTEPGWAPPASPATLAKLKRANTSVSKQESEKLWHEIQYATYWKEPMAMTIVDLVSLNLASASVHGLQVLPNVTYPMNQVWLQK